MSVRLRWGIEWHSVNKRDGDTRFIAGESRIPPLVFRSRREAREYIKNKYDYIATRPDLRQEPHGWRMPQAVRVNVSIEKAL